MEVVGRDVGQTEWMIETKMMDGGQDDRLEIKPGADRN